MDNNNLNTDIIEKGIGVVMRIGVAVAAIFMIAGFIILIASHDSASGFNEIILSQIWFGLFSFNPYSYMLLGIFILILTPVLRVIASIVLFLKTKDMLYTAITSLVLIILLISFFVAASIG